jgi:hypothetical protein
MMIVWLFQGSRSVADKRDEFSLIGFPEILGQEAVNVCFPGFVVSVALVFYTLGILDRGNVKTDRNSFVVTANDHEIERFTGDIQFLMRHIRREVDEITGAHLRCKLKTLSPTYLTAPFYHIDRNLMTPVVMGAGPRMWFESNRAYPRFSSPSTGKIKCGRTPGA